MLKLSVEGLWLPLPTMLIGHKVYMWQISPLGIWIDPRYNLPI